MRMGDWGESGDGDGWGSTRPDVRCWVGESGTCRAPLGREFCVG